jgi:hypothetical protein
VGDLCLGCDDNIEMDLGEFGCESRKWTELDQQTKNPMTGFCEHVNELLGSIKRWVGHFLTGWVIINILAKNLHHGVRFRRC